MPQLLDLPTETLRKILGLVQGDAVVKCCFNGSDCVCKHLRPPHGTTNIVKDAYSDIKLVCRRLRAITKSVEEPITLVFPRTNCTKSYSRLGSLARIPRIGAIQISWALMAMSEDPHFDGGDLESCVESSKEDMRLCLPPIAVVNLEWAACAQDLDINFPGTTKLMVMWDIRLQASH